MWRQDDDQTRGYNYRGSAGNKTSGGFMTLDVEPEGTHGTFDGDFRRHSETPVPEIYSTNRRAASTTAASSYSTNPFKSMLRSQERDPDNADNLLQIVQEGTNTRSNWRSNASRGTREHSEVENPRSSFLDELLPYEDEKKEDAYRPIVGGSYQSRGPAKMTGELIQRIGHLYGTGSTAREERTLQKQRPFTADVGFNQGISAQKSEAIEEISMPFSRRRSKQLREKDQPSTRPHTTPIENSRAYNNGSNQILNDDSQTNQDNTSNLDTARNNLGGNEHPQRDDDEDINSEYITAVVRGRDKLKPKSKPVEVDYDPTGILVPRETTKKPHVLKESFGGGFKNRQDDNQSTNSQKLGDYHVVSPGFSAGAGSLYGFDQTKPISRDRDSLAQQPFESPVMTANARLDAKGNFSNKLLTANVYQPGTIYQAYPKTELSLPGLEDFLARPQFGLIDRQFAGEENPTNKIFKETIEYYKTMIEELKRLSLEEIAKIDESHAQEIALLKKEKNMLSEQMELALQRERERLKEIHTQELQSRERLYKLELEQQKRLSEESSESLKKQLEVQIRLGSLAEEFRHSSFKIESIYHKIGQDSSSVEQIKKRELEERERLLQDKETRIMSDIAILEKEKLRYDRLINELQSKEAEIVKRADDDREIIKKEYNRLYELQDMVKEKEIETKKELIHERIKFEQLKAKLEQENSSLVEEYNRKLKDLEHRTKLFENEKREFEQSMQKSSQEMTQKSKQIDETRQKLALLEADLLKKARENEITERSVIKGFEELKTKLQVYENERAALEAERAKVYEIAKNSRGESETVKKFRSEFDTEKERLKRMKIELDTYSSSLQNEKLKLEQERSDVAKSQRIVEGLRYGYLKTIDTKPPIRTPISTTDLSFQVGLDTGGKKRNGRSLSSQEFFLKESQLHSVPVQEPSSAFGQTISVKNLREQIDSRGFFRTDRSHNKVRASSSQGFNLTSYMKDLKTLDRTCDINGEYISREKSSLIRSKLEISTPSKARSTRSGTFKVESPFI